MDLPKEIVRIDCGSSLPRPFRERVGVRVKVPEPRTRYEPEPTGNIKRLGNKYERSPYTFFIGHGANPYASDPHLLSSP